jgi:hypothetical protein
MARRLTTRAQSTTPNQHLIDPVLVKIFTEEKQYLDGLFNDIIERNQAKGGSMNAFRYNGSSYTNTSIKDTRNDIRELHPDLHAEFDTYLESLLQLQKDTNRIKNMLSTVMRKCAHPQDFRDVLPDALSCDIPELSELDRIRDEGWVFRQEPMKLQQFQAVMDLAINYIARRLILT